MNAGTPSSEVRRAKPQLNVYAGLLAAALLFGILGVTVLFLQNAGVSDSSGVDGAFTPVSPSR
jgi:hypothetical protein